MTASSRATPTLPRGPARPCGRGRCGHRQRQRPGPPGPGHRRADDVGSLRQHAHRRTARLQRRARYHDRERHHLSQPGRALRTALAAGDDNHRPAARRTLLRRTDPRPRRAIHHHRHGRRDDLQGPAVGPGDRHGQAGHRGPQERPLCGLRHHHRPRLFRRSRHLDQQRPQDHRHDLPAQREPDRERHRQQDRRPVALDRRGGAIDPHPGQRQPRDQRELQPCSRRPASAPKDLPVRLAPPESVSAPRRSQPAP